MKVIVFGATGMVGQGVVRECLLDPGVDQVLVLGRRALPPGQRHGKLRELVHGDFLDFSAVEAQFAGYDACFFCLGVSSLGLDEAAYRRVTYDMALAAAQAIARHSPALTFVFVSGAGSDSSEKGRVMWARIKGMTENALLRLPFKAVFVFRPGYIQPLHGARARTRWTRVLYAIVGPLYPLWRWLFPRHVTTTERVGRAMIRAARQGAPRQILENHDIDALGAAAG